MLQSHRYATDYCNYSIGKVASPAEINLSSELTSISSSLALHQVTCLTKTSNLSIGAVRTCQHCNVPQPLSGWAPLLLPAVGHAARGLGSVLVRLNTAIASSYALRVCAAESPSLLNREQAVCTWTPIMRQETAVHRQGIVEAKLAVRLQSIILTEIFNVSEWPLKDTGATKYLRHRLTA